MAILAEISQGNHDRQKKLYRKVLKCVCVCVFKLNPDKSKFWATFRRTNMLKTSMIPERTPELSIMNGDMALVCLMPSDIEKIRPDSVLSYRAKF